MKRTAFVLLALALAGTAQAQWWQDRFHRRPPPGFIMAPHIVDRFDSLPLARQTVVVFVGPGCPSCLDAVQDARSPAVGISVPVEVMDVSTPMAQELFARIGGRVLPTTVAGTQMLVGRDPNLLKSMAGGAGMVQSPSAP